MSTEIKPGNVVQLKGGGPLMTVRWVGEQLGESTVCCDWFVQDKAPWKKETDTFPPTSLKIVEA